MSYYWCPKCKETRDLGCFAKGCPGIPHWMPAPPPDYVDRINAATKPMRFSSRRFDLMEIASDADAEVARLREELREAREALRKLTAAMRDGCAPEMEHALRVADAALSSGAKESDHA